MFQRRTKHIAALETTGQSEHSKEDQLCTNYPKLFQHNKPNMSKKVKMTLKPEVLTVKQKTNALPLHLRGSVKKKRITSKENISKM